MATNAHKIYRGIDPNKKTVTDKKVAGAYLPGTFVTSSATTLTVPSSGVSQGRLMLLGALDPLGQSLATAYTSGDTGSAFDLLPGDEFIARFDAGTYAYGAELSVGTNGRLKAAASAQVVFATYTGSGVALSAGDFDDIFVINSYVKA